MNPQASLAEGLAVAAHKIGTASSTALVTGAIDVSKYDQLLFVFHTRDMAAETINGGVQTCDSDGTSNAANITGKQITELAAHASNNDDKAVVVAVKAADLIANGKQYVRGRLVTGGATGGTCAITVLGTTKYGPADGYDVSTVLEVVK